MIEKINDVRSALKNGNYYCAIALALTFPDICSQVENAIPKGQNGSNQMYIDWVNKHMEYDDFRFPIQGCEAHTFNGEMCYSLRCKILHNGSTDVKNKRLNVSVDDFVLTKPMDKEYFHGYKYADSYQKDGVARKITYIGIDYLCERLCDAAEKFFNSWETKADFDIHRF